MTRGFITLATGNEKYYKTAVNLLKSYLLFHLKSSKYYNQNSKRLPFAILADRENEYTKLFDDVIVLKNPTKSYFDKISLLDNIPYDETIFVEADCLAYTDLNQYFNIFKNAADFSVIGEALPKSAKNGWFLIEEAGKYKECIDFIPNFHSAIMYMKKGQKCSDIYNICMEVNQNYSNYMIGGRRDAIDDKLLALSSAVIGCKPTSTPKSSPMNPFLVYPYCLVKGRTPKIGIHVPKSRFYINNKAVDNMICHWGNYLTNKYLYKREVHSVDCILKGVSPMPYVYYTSFLYPLYKINEFFHFLFIPKTIDTLSKFSLVKKIWHKIRRT